MNIKKIINSNYEKFTKSDKMIACYFLSEKPAINAVNLATQLHVSQSSISRFISKIGIKNYETFINKYEDELSENTHQLAKNEIQDGHNLIMKKNYEGMNYDVIEQLISKINNNKVLIIAIENTALACVDFAKRINRFGNDVRVAKTREEIVIEISQLTKNDILVFVTISGINNFFEKQLQSLLEGVYVVGITSNDSILLKYSHAHIPVYYDNSSLLTQSFSYLLPLVVIFDNIYIKYFELASEKQHQTRKEIIDKILVK